MSRMAGCDPNAVIHDRSTEAGLDLSRSSRSSLWEQAIALVPQSCRPHSTPLQIFDTTN
jgi:hypothetical protein